jgi:hypothetical protein
VESALIYVFFWSLLVQAVMLGHVICSDKKTALPTIAWVAICITIPLIGYAFWLLEKDPNI